MFVRKGGRGRAEREKNIQTKKSTTTNVSVTYVMGRNEYYKRLIEENKRHKEILRRKRNGESKI